MNDQVTSSFNSLAESSVLLNRITESLTGARSLEALTRPFLAMLEEATGLESTYLTIIDLDAGTQSILYAHNTQAMQIPENLTVPWQDTLCKRAQDEGRRYTEDVSAYWGDSEAAAALGIKTYLSTPVYAGDGVLFGTLCAASSSAHKVDDHAQRVLTLFAALIGWQVERERLMAQLLSFNSQLSDLATTDELTHLPNRRLLLDLLQRQIEQANRDNRTILVGFIDMDGFKVINDTYGHNVGDHFLAAMANQLRQTLRQQDIIARYGGDEFAVVGPGPSMNEDTESALKVFIDRIASATQGDFNCAQTIIHYGGASVGGILVQPNTLDAVAALKQADEAMYKVKQTRRNQTQTQNN